MRKWNGCLQLAGSFALMIAAVVVCAFELWKLIIVIVWKS